MEINEKRVYQQVRNFERAIAGFDFKEPFARYLTRFFKENKQMGASDRRMTSRYCYNYFRIGKSFPDYSVQDRLVFAEFLCEQESAVVQLLHADLYQNITNSLSAKIAYLKSGFSLGAVFPLVDALSPDIDQDSFVSSHFTQPDLFIRVKRGWFNEVRSVFDKAEVDYKVLSDTTLSLANGTKLQNFPALKGKYEVQDLSSQATIDYIEANDNESWWDACAASGGKALMFLDRYPKAKLLVSDVRLSILRNLDERFEQAAITQYYRKKVIDLVQGAKSILGEEEFDGIILDVPCSGSGTWGRTPEMMQTFSEQKLKEFSLLQKKIISNTIPHLKRGHALTYITCSVYQNENEDNVAFMLDNFPLVLDKMQVLKGYTQRADSMFVARLIKK